MRSGNNSIAFSGERISELFTRAYENIQSSIERESENYILSVNETDYINHLEIQYQLKVPEIHFDQFCVDSYEGDVQAERFPISFDVYPGKTYKREIIRFFIPCSGDINLLRYCPASMMYGSRANFEIRDDTLVIEFVNFSNKADEITGNYEKHANRIHGIYNSLKNDIDKFNNTLKDQIVIFLNRRKQKLLSKNNFLSSLGVPLRKKDNVATTFAIPKPQLREKIFIKPIVHEKSFKAEPTLDDANYHKILKFINDVGKNFERMPSVYAGKKEEDLRDHILMILDPNFELGSASGETFNKSGKTDIQLRYDSSVVFIAECKFWSGEKNFLETIDQLLGYLTWRDSKTAVIIFVRNKEIIPVLETVKQATIGHKHFIKELQKNDQGWFNYIFCLPTDRNKEIKLAVQFFHLPQ